MKWAVWAWSRLVLRWTGNVIDVRRAFLFPAMALRPFLPRGWFLASCRREGFYVSMLVLVKDRKTFYMDNCVVRRESIAG